MDDFYDDLNPFYESRAYLMSDLEEDEFAPEPEVPEEEPGEPEPETPEEESSEPEPGVPEEEPSEPEPEPSEEEPSEPEPEVPEEEPSEPEPEAPEKGETDGDSMKDLIDAIGDLNETITGAVTQEPEELPAGGEGGGDPGGDIQVTESPSVDLTPVVKVLERNEKLLIHTNELLEQQNEALVTQHNDLLQLQANVDFVFLAVAALIGVVLGVAVGKVFHDLWRA